MLMAAVGRYVIGVIALLGLPSVGVIIKNSYTVANQLMMGDLMLFIAL
jgi:hypothetical protein